MKNIEWWVVAIAVGLAMIVGYVAGYYTQGVL